MKRINRKTAKKTLSLLTAGMMLLSVGSFTGCSGSKGSVGNNSAVVDQQEAMKTLAFKVTDIELEDSEDIGYGGFAYKNGLFYAISSKYEMKNDNYFVTISLVIYDENGKIKNKSVIFEQTDPSVSQGVNGNFNVDNDGNVSFLMSINKYDPETYDGESTYKFVTYDTNGALVSEHDMGSIVTQEDADNNMYFQGYVQDAQGNIYLNMGTCIRVLDSSGNKLFETEKMSWEQNTWLGDLFLTNAGVPAVLINEYSDDKSKTTIRELDAQAKGFGKEYDISSTNYRSNFYGGSGEYLSYFATDTGISGLRASDLSVVSVLNLLNLGVDNSNIETFEICDDGSFITLGYNYRGGRSSRNVCKITPVDASEVKEKKILTLGCYYMDWTIRGKIAEFNKKNEDYTIYATSFSESNDTSDWEAALTKFNNELLAGNVPDMLLLNNQMPVSSYTAKGLFCDLYTMMEKDPELNKDAFLPNVLEAFETKGKLYELTPSFTIESFAAKTSRVGTNRFITVSQATDYVAQMPEGAQLFSEPITSEIFITQGVMYSDFIDFENAKCSFDTPEFKKFLEIAKTFPAEIDYEKLYNENPNYWEENQTACRDDKALLYPVYFSNFSEYNQVRDGYFGEDITFTGFPVSTEGVSGSFIYPSTEIAISAKSKYKEGAWEFLKAVILDSVTEEPLTIWNGQTGEQVDTGETRYSSAYYGLPVLKDQLDNLAAQAMIPSYYIDENGNKVSNDNTFYVGNQEITISTPTQADIDYVKDYISSVNRAFHYDNSISKILSEETKLYFDGSKSADETASVIQSRISLYLSEQY